MKRATAIAIAIMLAAPGARAGPARKGARIAWVRGIDAEGCVGRIGLEEDVKARLGWDPFSLPVELSIEGGVVRAMPTGFRAEIVVRDASGKLLGSRRLASKDADCRSLGEAVAVAITVAIDPDAPGTRAPTIEETPPEPPPPAPPTTTAVPPPAPRNEERMHALLEGGGSAGLVPDVAPLVSLRVRAILGERLELGVGAHFFPESRRGGVGFAIATGSLDACAVTLSEARWLRWCAAFHAGTFEVFVHAPELAPVDVGAFPWLAIETGPAVSLPIGGRLRLELGVSVVVPLLRRQALVRGISAPIWEQSGAGGRADVGLGATF